MSGFGGEMAKTELEHLVESAFDGDTQLPPLSGGELDELQVRANVLNMGVVKAATVYQVIAESGEITYLPFAPDSVPVAVGGQQLLVRELSPEECGVHLVGVNDLLGRETAQGE